MRSSEDRETLRDRTRRAVRSEVIDVAQQLFVEHGYNAVTVDQIAAAAGMSRRSFFRYFAGKEDVVLGKVDRHGSTLVDALAARPDDEPAWVALRRMFDGVVAADSGADGARRALAMDRVIRSSETLRAGYLQRLQHAQELVADELSRRERRRGTPGWGEADAAALVGAAFAAAQAAFAVAESGRTPFAEAVDGAMGAISRESGLAAGGSTTPDDGPR